MLLTFSISFLKDSMSILISVVSLSAIVLYIYLYIKVYDAILIFSSLNRLILYSLISVFFLLLSFCFLIRIHCKFKKYNLSFFLFLICFSIVFFSFFC